MVIYSNEIKEFLDKIYFYELSHGNDWNTPLYNYYEGKLYNIDKLTRHTPSTTFPMSSIVLNINIIKKQKRLWIYLEIWIVGIIFANVSDIYKRSINIYKILNMTYLKEDGSLNIKRINQLPIEEYMDVMGDLTEEQYKEYLSKLPVNESNEPIKVIMVDRPMGVNADDVINNIG